MALRQWFVLFLAIILLAGAGGCQVIAQTTITGSGSPQIRDFDLKGYSGLQTAAGFEVQVDRADGFKVQVIADDNAWDFLDISVSGGTLHLRMKPAAVLRNATLKAAVTMPALRSLDVSGASQVTIAGFSGGDDLNANISGAGKLAAENVKFGSTNFDVSGGGQVSGSAVMTDSRLRVSGGGTVDLGGSGTSLAIDGSGGARLTLDQFVVHKASVTLSGGTEAHVNCEQLQTADLSGASHLYYVGSPALGKIQTSGGSSVTAE
jgi:hypothetical protein